jgi:hypothetical protein
MYGLSMVVMGINHDWPLSSTGILGPVFFMVMFLSVESYQGYNEADRAECRGILRPFNNAKTLRVKGGFIRDVSRAL